MVQIESSDLYRMPNLSFQGTIAFHWIKVKAENIPGKIIVEGYYCRFG